MNQFRFTSYFNFLPSFAILSILCAWYFFHHKIQQEKVRRADTVITTLGGLFIFLRSGKERVAD